jgi:hypothetical protein
MAAQKGTILNLLLKGTCPAGAHFFPLSFSIGTNSKVFLTNGKGHKYVNSS